MLNAVPMPLPKQADRIPGPINDDGEQAGDVATEYAHVEGLGLCDGGVLPAQRHLAPAFGRTCHAVSRDCADRTDLPIVLQE